MTICVSSSFTIQHSMLDVRCSMFIFFQYPSSHPQPDAFLVILSDTLCDGGILLLFFKFSFIQTQ